MTAWILAGVLLIAVCAIAWIGVRGYLAYQHLTNARTAAGDAASVLSDPAQASDLISTISAETSAARELTSDVIWQAGERLPWAGPQLAAVATMTRALDDVASDALTPLAAVSSSFSLDSIRPKDGTIDLAAFGDLREAATAGVSGLRSANSAISGIDTAPLVSPLQDAIDEVSGLLKQAGTGADALQRTTVLLPAMLGADGPRDYLVVFQNNAEWRSLGGIVGAMVLVHTDGGKMTIGAQASSSDFSRYDDPVVPLTDDELRLFGKQPATFMQNVTQIPDFTRDAPIIQAMWERERGTTVDGVLSLDPVALSYLLNATGPVELPTGDELTSDNAVQLLLNEVYLRYENSAHQDAFFAAAAAAVFSSLTAGATEPAALVSALGRAGEEDRLMIWNAAAEEQSILDGTTLQGSLASSGPSSTDFGVYLNDGTASKMDYYMEAGSEAAWCESGEAALSVTLRNTAPQDAASLPSYVTGGGLHGVPPGNVETVSYIYLPDGATLISTAAADPAESPRLGGGTDADRQVLVWTTRLAPGEEATLLVRVDTPRTEHIVTRMTPTVHTQNEDTVAALCEMPE